jgi:transglutaminase-like putative cysteine protease
MRRLALPAVDEVCPNDVPALALLETKEGDCSEHALLFTTLARAAGIPAREVTGLMYMGDETEKVATEKVQGPLFGGHAWNEVVIEGHWVPVDATHDEVVVDATHISFGREKRDGEFANAVGALRFKVVSVKPTPPKGEKDDR